MPNIDLLLSRASVGSRANQTRSDFHVYLWPYDGIATLQPSLGAPGLAMMDYYASKGMNFCRDHYQISGGGAYIEAYIRSGVDYWAARAEALRIDLWFLDTETSFYTGLAVDAASDLAGAQNAASWSKSQWATHHGTTMYVGNYGNSTGIRTTERIGYPFNKTEKTFRDDKNNNDVNGQYVAAAWDWMGPELYQGKIDEFTQGLDWLCNEKSRLGITTPLIPFIWRHAAPSTISTYNFMTA